MYHHHQQHQQQQQIMMSNFGDQLDYYGSDCESVISDTMVNGQVSPSRGDWSPVSQGNTWTDYGDQQDFSNIFTGNDKIFLSNSIHFTISTTYFCPPCIYMLSHMQKRLRIRGD